MENSRETALKDVKLWQSNGYNLIKETPEYFLLKKSVGFWKHFWVFMFTWWSCGAVNVILHFALSRTKKIII